MITALLAHIKTHLLTNNPATFANGYSGGRQYQDGKIVVYDEFEGTYVGLKDSESNYFYIRDLDEISFDLPTQRTTSCLEVKGTGNNRLVAWVRKANRDRLIEVLVNDLLTVDWKTLSTANKLRFSYIKIIAPTQVIIDPERIFKDETLSNDVRLPNKTVLVAIDFLMQFNYKSRIESCLNREICEPC